MEFPQTVKLRASIDPRADMVELVKIYMQTCHNLYAEERSELWKMVRSMVRSMVNPAAMFPDSPVLQSKPLTQVAVILPDGRWADATWDAATLAYRAEEPSPIGITGVKKAGER